MPADVHLVLGPAKDGKPIRFTVKLDARHPARTTAADADAAVQALSRSTVCINLIRQKGPVEDRTFEIEFLGSRRAGVCFHVWLMSEIGEKH